jgi:hypothetical protein
VKQHRRNTIIVLFSVLAGLGMSHAQGRGSVPAQGPSPGHSAQGQLTVTVTVVTSVGLVTGPDGVQRLVVANGSDAGDNVSSLKPFVDPSPQSLATAGEKNSPEIRKSRPLGSLRSGV